MGREKLLKLVDFSRDGWVPVAVVDDRDGRVLMLASMDRQALGLTLRTGKMHYLSRTRGTTWMKGESSGHVQLVREIWVDCDPVNRLLFRVEQKGGAACHTGYRSCFHRKVNAKGELKTIGRKVFEPRDVYGKDSRKVKKRKRS